MKDAIIIFFGVIYILAALYLSFAINQTGTRIMNRSKIVSKKEKKVYVVFLMALAGLIFSILLLQ